MSQTFNDLFAEYIRLTNAGSLKQANLKLVEIIRLMWDRIGDDVCDTELTDEEYDMILNGDVTFIQSLDIDTLDARAAAQDALALGHDAVRPAVEPMTMEPVVIDEDATEDTTTDAELAEGLDALAKALTVGDPAPTDKAVLDAEAASNATTQDGIEGETDADTDAPKRRASAKKKAA